jgi:hypothetical protein
VFLGAVLQQQVAHAPGRRAAISTVLDEHFDEGEGAAEAFGGVLGRQDG